MPPKKLIFVQPQLQRGTAVHPIRHEARDPQEHWHPDIFKAAQGVA